MSRLVSQLIRKDLRQHATLCTLWFVLTLVDAVVSIRFVGLPASLDPVRVTPLFQGPTVLLIPILRFVIPSLIVLSNSPARPDRFLATRPVPRRDLVVANVVAVVLVIILPEVLKEFVVLLSQRVPFGSALHAGVERLVMVTIVAGAGAAFAMLWENAKEWMAALGGGAILSWLTMLALHWIGRHVPLVGRLARLEAQPLPVWLASVLVGSIAVAGLAALGWPRERPFRWRAAAAALVGVGVMVLGTTVPWDPFPVRLPDAATALPVLADAPLRVPLPGVELSMQGGDGRQSGTLRAQLRPRLDALPRDCFVDWSVSGATCAVGDEEYAASTWAGPRSVFRSSGTIWHGSADSVAAALGPRALLISRSYPSSSLPGVSMSFRGPEPARYQSEAVVLRCTFRGVVFRTTPVATLSLAAGETAGSPTSSWRITGTRRDERNGSLTVGLALRKLGLHTSPRPEERRTPYWPRDRYGFVLWNPGRGLALSSDSNMPSSSVVGSHTSLQSAHLTPRFSPNTLRSVARSIISDPDTRLIVLEKRVMGTLERAWHSPPMLFAHRPSLADDRRAITEGRMPRAEFRRRLAALGPPAPNASRTSVGHYLYELLCLLEARRATWGERSPQVLGLVPYVSAHPGVFLDGLFASAGRFSANRVLRCALSVGLSPDHSPLLFDRLAVQPDLASIVLDRGWTDAAAPQLRALLNLPGRLPYEVIQALAWFEDPETYPRLLDEFESNPSLRLYELLRQLPGIRPGLDERIDRLWSRLPRTLARTHAGPSPVLAVAARCGRREALKEAYRRFILIPEEQRTQDWGLLQAFRENVTMAGVRPGYQDSKQEAVVWIEAHPPDRLRYDIFLRRFVPAQP